MVESFAGIAIFPAGLDEFHVSISLRSSTRGSIIYNKSTSLPINIKSLTETVRSLISSPFPRSTMIKTYVISMPAVFPADRFYDVFKAVESAKIAGKHWYPRPPLNHGEAWTARLAKGQRVALLALDFTSPKRLLIASITSIQETDERVNRIPHCFSISFTDKKSLQEALQRIAIFQEGSDNHPTKIVVIKSTGTPVEIDVNGLVTDIYPGVPVASATMKDIAQAAASFAYANFCSHVHRLYGRQGIIAPVSVATATGTTALLAPSNHLLKVDSSIIFNTVVDDQKSVTVRLLVGNHPLAKDNLQRAVVVLDGLKPLPRGEACIRVWLQVSGRQRWHQTAEVLIEQRGGPSKTFLFPRFFSDLPEDHRKYDIVVKREESVPWTLDSRELMGRLPE